MIFAPVTPPTPVEEAAESYSQRPPVQLVAHFEPAKRDRLTFAFRRKVLPIEGGRVLLRLTEVPSVAVDPATMECEVLGWGVKMPTASVENLPNAMGRRFLELFSKVDAGSLDEIEQRCWAQILDQVDFQAFSIDRAAPHYMEGTLVRLDPVCLVEWHDGERQKIDRDVARALGCLQPGDEFAAFVKLGRDNSVRLIERIVILSAAVA